MSQALVVRDRFDNQDIVDDLKKYIHANGINKIVEIGSLNEISQAKMLLNLYEPCILFQNVFTRYDTNLMELIRFHKEHKFSNLWANGDRIISFIPFFMSKKYKNTSVLESTENNDFYAHTKVNYICPKEKPTIFLYTHNRDIYLKLTLNSLNFSLIEKIPIKILLSQPTDSVRQVALDFAKDKDYVEVLETKENTFFTSINILLQYFKPEKFIIAEDDFIFPYTTKNHFPNWPFQFLDRLNYFDVVAWSVFIENVHSYSFSLPRWSQEPQCMGDWEMIINRESKTFILGQALAVRTDFYIKSAKAEKDNPYMCAYDSTLHSFKKCTPSLKGYHIGFNQEMDGFCSLRSNRWPPPIDVCHIKSLTTGEEKTIYPKDLLL